jgi:poly-gamma-glutamate capsule biosynthesis protein CapA/YwtB (metallophosphatase superfamily)
MHARVVCSTGRLASGDLIPLRRALYILATMAVLVSFFPLWISSSTERSGRQAETHPRTTEVSERQHSKPSRSETRVPRFDRQQPQASLVPIAHLASTRESISVEELSRTPGLAVPRDLLDEARRLLHRSGFRSFDSAGKVVEHVSRSQEALGLVPWDEVGPRVRTLAVAGVSLLEPGAEASRGYPLATGGMRGPDPGELRRVVVGGDIVLDRGQNYMVIQRGMGLDFPLDGGYAAVTGRTPIRSQYSESGVIHEFTAERRGRSGAVRDYLRGADLTLANFENPVVRGAIWHPDAPTFTGDPRLLPILEQAGIDGVTLGNNHTLDAGVSGLRETMHRLDAIGVAHAGAGMDLASARQPMILKLGNIRVGVLSYQGVPYYEWAWATESAPGTAPLKEELMREDVKRLRPRVDLVVVMPHWGREYIATPEPWQVRFAHAAVEAGADLVVGDHAHWPKGIEVYRGAPIYYGTGNFLFDQSWSEETSTGIFAEITLYRDRVVQAQPVPFIVLDYAQPNFLVPEEGGDRALRRIFSTSLGPEFESYNPSAR